MVEHRVAKLNPTRLTVETDAATSPSFSAEEEVEHAQLAREFEDELDALLDTLEPAGKRALRLVLPPDPPGWPDF